MKNLRTVHLSVREQYNFDPMDFATKLLNAGFKFDHIGCPYKITKPWDYTENENGSVTYRQWEE